MQTFNLKTEYFYKIRNNLKTHEYREITNYWAKRITKLNVNDIICFKLGYPNNNNFDKILYAKILSIKVINGINTDLKINKNVYDIEFLLIDNKELRSKY